MDPVGLVAQATRGRLGRQKARPFGWYINSRLLTCFYLGRNCLNPATLVLFVPRLAEWLSGRQGFPSNPRMYVERGQKGGTRMAHVRMVRWPPRPGGASLDAGKGIAGA